MAISAEEVLSQSTAYATSAYNATMQQRSAQLSSMANSANQLYIQAANQAAVQAGTVGREQALRQALTDLAGKGVSISTYMRKDGVTVTTPVDVGVRRMINDQLRQRGIQQVTELAKELDRNYVEVSITANCRESHAEWQGQIYSLEPDDETYPYFYDACNYGDPVDGIGGYNCGHEVHIYRPEIGSTFTDPLEGTEYTTEEVRELTVTQRALENNIRKTKRQVSTLKAAGYDTTALSAKLRNYKQQLSELLNTHSAVLRDAGSYRTGVNRAQLSLSQSKIIPKAIYEKPWSALTSHEQAGIRLLAQNNIVATVLKENPKAAANIDLKINGELWEMKNVTSVSSVSNQFGRARAKWSKLGLDTGTNIVFTVIDPVASIDDIIDAVKTRMRTGEKAIILFGEIILRLP